MPETDDLVTAHLSLAEYLGSRFRCIPLDDAKQEAMVGLVVAGQKFSVDRGVKFETFASAVIRNRLRSAVNNYQPIPIHPGHEPHVERSNDEEIEALRVAMEKLAPDVRRALEMRYGEEPATFQAIGIALDCSHEHARAVVAAGLATLKKLMEGRD